MATQRPRGAITEDTAHAVTTIAASLQEAYARYWPRGDTADPSERHLSFSMAVGLRERGYTTYFEVPFDNGYLDLVAVNWSRRREVAVEFKNLYAGGKQARSMARDVRRLRRWPGVEQWSSAERRAGIEFKRVVLGSTWQARTRDDWYKKTKRFEDVRRAFSWERAALTWGHTDGALVPGTALPQQWLLWVHW